MELMLLVLFLMALHSTIFSPAKYGIVPEMLPDRDLSRANALLEMSTFVAIVLGTSGGGLLFTAWKTQAWKIGLATLAVAVTGLLTSLRITRVAASGAPAPFRWNPFAEVSPAQPSAQRPPALADRAGHLLLLVPGRAVSDGPAAVRQGSAATWTSGASVLMVTFLAIGIGVGSMLAGRLSGDKVELGLVPLGSILMGVFSLGLYGARSSYALVRASLALLGLASGLFIVPLNAYLQQRSEEGEKGRMIATNNFYNTIGMLLASGTLWPCTTSCTCRPTS